MKTFTTLAAVIFAALFVAPATASGFYVGTYGGMNWDDVVAAPFVDTNSGYVIGGTVGTSVASLPGVRVELDMSFRQNEVDLFGGLISADHDTFGLLGNVVWDLPLTVGVARPYVLAGVGYASTEATFEDVALLKLENAGVAYQLGAGFSAAIADGVTAGVGYRYFAGPDIEVLGTELSNGTNHSVLASVTFAFN